MLRLELNHVSNRGPWCQYYACDARFPQGYWADCVDEQYHECHYYYRNIWSLNDNAIASIRVMRDIL